MLVIHAHISGPYGVSTKAREAVLQPAAATRTVLSSRALLARTHRTSQLTDGQKRLEEEGPQEGRPEVRNGLGAAGGGGGEVIAESRNLEILKS